MTLAAHIASLTPTLCAVRIAEIGLGQITVKVLFAAVLIDALHPTLED
jgi:hypothetical protein